MPNNKSFVFLFLKILRFKYFKGLAYKFSAIMRDLKQEKEAAIAQSLVCIRDSWHPCILRGDTAFPVEHLQLLGLGWLLS